MTAPTLDPLFWETKSLEAMNQQEWEALCDGCALCCFHKLQDDETEEVFYTRVACRYLDDKAYRCQHYQKRSQYVESCLILKPDNVKQQHWLPETCAYKLIAEGKPLFNWHPLISGDDQSAKGYHADFLNLAINEEYIPTETYEEHIVKWVDL